MAADAQMMSHFYNPLHHMYGSLHSSRYPVSSTGDKYPPGSGGGGGTGNDGSYLADSSSRYMSGPGAIVPDKYDQTAAGDRSPSTPIQQNSYDERQYLTPPSSNIEIPEVKPLAHQLLKEDNFGMVTNTFCCRYKFINTIFFHLFSTSDCPRLIF